MSPALSEFEVVLGVRSLQAASWEGRQDMTSSKHRLPLPQSAPTLKRAHLARLGHKSQ